MYNNGENYHDSAIAEENDNTDIQTEKKPVYVDTSEIIEASSQEKAKAVENLRGAFAANLMSALAKVGITHTKRVKRGRDINSKDNVKPIKKDNLGEKTVDPLAQAVEDLKSTDGLKNNEKYKNYVDANLILKKIASIVGISTAKKRKDKK